ncbi:hypothetical protein EI77_02281 [Prosthecobacter fusiformis]|uniref:Uncharacterized protein n=1 Tax=Prosthecobacter fusiformis TaxID=48464 RepID=A0A4R7RZ23_9BACT|nr:hypothetical protein [Prosthecobacter fusiformis]TDU71162.1 hypothetical protein EI77_02281 [Prosthecobacter fusiformis]
MFKKILQSLSKSQAAKPAAAAAPVSKPAETAKPAGPVPKAGKAAAIATPAVAKTPEELCEIGPKMPKDQIHSRLKLLYRRYNRSASSLDPKIRGEADSMLDAIVRVREKHFGEI